MQGICAEAPVTASTLTCTNPLNDTPSIPVLVKDIASPVVNSTSTGATQICVGPDQLLEPPSTRKRNATTRGLFVRVHLESSVPLFQLMRLSSDPRLALQDGANARTQMLDYIGRYSKSVSICPRYNLGACMLTTVCQDFKDVDPNDIRVHLGKGRVDNLEWLLSPENIIPGDMLVLLSTSYLLLSSHCTLVLKSTHSNWACNPRLASRNRYIRVRDPRRNTC